MPVRKAKPIMNRKQRKAAKSAVKNKRSASAGKTLTDARGNKYIDLGGGRSQGVSNKKPRMKKVKAAPTYSSKKRGQTKRKTGGYTRK